LFIDNLRSTMIILVISMHAADTYSPLGNWYYVDRPDLELPSLLTFAASSRRVRMHSPEKIMRHLKGRRGGQNGQVDTVGIIDLEANPPRVIDQVVVGDGPEGLAMSPAGGYAASLILNGTGATPKNAFYRHEHSYVALLKIDGKTVRKVAQAEVGGLAEGITFSPDGRFLYVGNFVDGDMRLDSDALTKIGSLALAGHPASMRGSTP
jgi:DNA-binding beta-propeller fold protein YncE